jgi:hypothetical protein
MFAGHVIEIMHAWFTVTEKLHDPVLPDVSTAVHVTVVVPIGNDDPDGGTQPKLAKPHGSAAPAE